MRYGIVSLIAGTILATAAWADPPPATPASSSTTTMSVETVKADPNAIANPKNDTADSIVCRSMGAATGTRLGNRRECKTQREWERDRLEQERQLGKNEVKGCVSNASGNCSW